MAENDKDTCRVCNMGILVQSVLKIDLTHIQEMKIAASQIVECAGFTLLLGKQPVILRIPIGRACNNPTCGVMYTLEQAALQQEMQESLFDFVQRSRAK